MKFVENGIFQKGLKIPKRTKKNYYKQNDLFKKNDLRYNSKKS